MVALVLAAGLQAGEVGAGARLGIALTPLLLAAGDAGQVARFLVLGAELQDGRADAHDAEAADRMEQPRVDGRFDGGRDSPTCIVRADVTCAGAAH